MNEQDQMNLQAIRTEAETLCDRLNQFWMESNLDEPYEEDVTDGLQALKECCLCLSLGRARLQEEISQRIEENP